MTTQDTRDANSGPAEHPAGGIEAILVDPQDVITAIRRNSRDENERRSHVLRLNPPFEGEVTARPYVNQPGNDYPPEMDPVPIHLPPEAFIVGHDAGRAHSEFESHWAFPDQAEQKALFREEIDATGPDGDYRQLTEDEEAEWDEWWEMAVEVWEENVREAIKTTDKLRLFSDNPETDQLIVSVRIEGQQPAQQSPKPGKAGTIFDAEEVLKKTVNSTGQIYVGRDLEGETIRIAYEIVEESEDENEG